MRKYIKQIAEYKIIY